MVTWNHDGYFIRDRHGHDLATDLCLSWPKVLNLVTVRASLKTPVYKGSGEFGPFTIRPSGIFGEFGLLAGEFGPQLENSANYTGEFGLLSNLCF